ncbi:MAG: PAS domain-containing protein [Acidobacteria bacterium]|nr:PAS domain-containing protein [Acidobacteriota bacterium]
MTAVAWHPEWRAELVDQFLAGVMVLDRSLAIADHNRAFTEMFGEARGNKCYKVLKGRSEPCGICAAMSTFNDGRRRVLEQVGQDREGRPVNYLVQVGPLRDPAGDIAFTAVITTDLTATKRLQREYQALFEKVPCYVAVLNRDFRVVKANEQFRRTFGEPTGEHCHEMFKKSPERCAGCLVEQTFRDGEPHTAPHTGIACDGETTHYLAFTTPLLNESGEVRHVIHMSLDVTEVRALADELGRANEIRRALVESSLDAIAVTDEHRRVVMLNRAAEQLWGVSRDDLVGRTVPRWMLPAELAPVLKNEAEQELVHDARVSTASGVQVPARIGAVSLSVENRFSGAAVFAQDLRELKKLEREKLEAERLAAVGQTVAGLAHGIKNILTGLEGGMYVTSSGLKRGDQGRIRQGWEMLERNMSRVSDLAKNLLAFSRGDHPEPELVRPADIVHDVVTLFRDGAAQHGIELEGVVDDSVEPAWMDPEAIHSCLANLVSNAIDACLVSQDPGCRVELHLREADAAIIFEVVDSGCGMDYEVKQKAFTSFFTTKGKGGTGLGLLLTRKIVQEHGGSITLESTPGQGSTFRLRFPRARLPEPQGKESTS